MTKSAALATVSVCFGIFIAFFFLATSPHAKQNIASALSEEDWNEVMEKVGLLEPSGLMPTLLPTIMLNRDTLELTDEQVDAFRTWRKEHYTALTHMMDEIIERMIQFRIAALAPGITGERLVASQAEIQEMQRKALDLKLSCRELIMTTFTDEQWENFAFVVSDNPKLGSLVSHIK
jgi:hypothetical protein